ncbi:MAG: radical SAM protein [Oscillospiraceae bacterium]|nr:radical SAM protein [Oscillospiraceae bacterium]
MGAIIPVFIPHVGCPHDCVFCNQKKIAGTLTAPDGADVKRIIEDALGYSGERPQIAFYGGSFTAVPRELMCEYLDAAKPFVDSGLAESLRLSTRPDSIDAERLEILRTSGVRTIELGTQSMCDDVLASSGRGHSSSDTRRAAALIKEYGFELILQMMTHLPGSDEAKDIETAREICRLRPDGVRIYPTVVIRDTALERLWRNGSYTPATPEQAAALGATLLDIFEESGIPVIRFGLNPTDDLSGGEALAGAYHPALGEMAQSARYLARAKKLIDSCEERGKALEISVCPKRVSVMSGQKKSNRKALCEAYGFDTVTVRGDAEIADGEMNLRFINK